MLSRTFGYALVIAALAVGGTTACGAAPVVEEETTPVVSDPWSVPSSSQTRSALGIETWGFRQVSSDTMAVTGYDVDHQRVAEIRQRLMALDAFHWTLDLGVARADAVSVFQYDLGSRAAENGTEVSGTVGNDSLSGDALARAILDKLRADLQSRTAGTTLQPAALQPAALPGTTLRPLGDYVNSGGNVVKGDDEKLIDENGNGTDDRCEGNQASPAQGANMMQSIAPVLGALGSLGQGGQGGDALSSLLSFVGIYQCMQGTGSEAQVAKQPIALYDLAKCSLQQKEQQQGGQNGQANNPAAGLMNGLSMLTGMTQAMSSLQSMGQQPQQQNSSCPSGR